MMVVEIFVAVGGFALGLWLGWYLRSRPEAAPATDPEVELRELREIHATCGARIRELHIELTKLESALAMAGIQPERLVSQDALIADEAKAESGAAHLASIIGALGADQRGQPDESDHGPAAFMSILPADLVEEGVKESEAIGGSDAEELLARHEEAEPQDASGDRRAARRNERRPESDRVEHSVSEVGHEQAESEMVVSLTGDDELSIAVERSDDLKLIRGIGPKIESILHGQGITTFQQIAELDEDGVAHLTEVLGAFRGRIERDDWIGSARDLVAERSILR